MLSINTNLSSLITQRSMKSATNLLNQAVERMSTGYKVNHAKDNAAAYSIITNMDTKIGAYQVAEDNVAMGLDMITTANESLSLISDKLNRLRDLTEQASNGTYGEQSLKAINSEANALVDEIVRLYSTAEYNGMKLFNNKDATPTMAAYGARMAISDYSQIVMTPLTKAYEEGALVEGETYSIKDKEELLKFAELVNAGNSGAGSTFVLIDDIDLSGVDWTPIGNDPLNNGYFSGVFDGNGKVIFHLTINDTSGSAQGFFGFVDGVGVEIKNLGLEEVNIRGGSNVGGIVGDVPGDIGETGSVMLANNYVTGSIYASNGTAGGLVGSLTTQGGSISFENNYSTATVTAQGNFAGGLIGSLSMPRGSINLFNNYFAGNIAGANRVGGIIGNALFFAGTVNIANNYSIGDVTGTDSVGGFLGYLANDTTMNISNCYATGLVSASSNVGGFIGNSIRTSPTMTNSVSVQVDNYATQMTVSEIAAAYTPESMGFSKDNGWTIVNGVPKLSWQFMVTGPLKGSNQISLQVGIGSDISSQICLEVGFSLGVIDDFRLIGLDTTIDFLGKIDDKLAVVNAKELEYGATQNRLESALDEISTQYENLVSSRSTLRDADIAEVSSQYIQQQILQQASATLMATANQMPAIALQLI